MISFAFPAAARLLQASDFKAVFDHALYKVHQPGFLILAINRKEADEFSRIGIIVAKKKLKRAHERNRFKRLTRESFRLHQQQMPALDIVIMAKQGADLLPNDQLHHDLDKAWQMLARRVHKQMAIVPNMPPSS